MILSYLMGIQTYRIMRNQIYISLKIYKNQDFALLPIDMEPNKKFQGLLHLFSSTRLTSIPTCVAHITMYVNHGTASKFLLTMVQNSSKNLHLLTQSGIPTRTLYFPFYTTICTFELYSFFISLYNFSLYDMSEKLLMLYLSI